MSNLEDENVSTTRPCPFCTEREQGDLVSEIKRFSRRLIGEFKSKEKELKEKDDIIKNLQRSEVKYTKWQEDLERRELHIQELERANEQFKAQYTKWQEDLTRREKHIQEFERANEHIKAQNEKWWSEHDRMDKDLKDRELIVTKLETNYMKWAEDLERRQRDIQEIEMANEHFKSQFEEWRASDDSMDKDREWNWIQLLAKYDNWRKSLDNEKKELEDKEKEIASREASYTKRQEDLERKERHIQEIDEQFRAEYRKCWRSHDSIDKELKKREFEVTQLEAKMREQFKEKDEEIRHLKAKVAKLSEDKVCRDQRTIENISSANRPSEVQAKCKEFSSGERMDAMDIIEQCRMLSRNTAAEGALYIEDSHIACSIFQMAHTEAYSAAQHFQRALPHIFNSAFNVGQTFEKEVVSQPRRKNIARFTASIEINRSDATHLTPTFENYTKRLLKEDAHNCIVDELTEKITKKLRDSTMLLVKYHRKVIGNLKPYISQCARLAWTMVTQTPPILIQTMDEKNGKHVTFDPTLHEQCRGAPSAHTGGHIWVKSILWPAMYEEGSERVICRGEVELT